MHASSAKAQSDKSGTHSRSNAAAVQAKLAVGKSDDHYEQEADKVAGKVVRMPSPSLLSGGADSSVRRSPLTSIAATRTAPKISRLSDLRSQRQTEEKTEGPIGPGYYRASKTTREIGFVFRNPIAAYVIGSVSRGSTNISTNAVRFSTNDLGLKKTASHEGSQVNAFRHTLWQTEITNQFGSQIAHELGNAHEKNPFAVSGDRASQRLFNSLSEADIACDLRNNIIGRSLGDPKNSVAMNQAALTVLDYFHTTGLWIATPRKDGKYVISQTRLTNEQYEEARERLLELNADGFDSAQQAKRDEEAARREFERTHNDHFNSKL